MIDFIHGSRVRVSHFFLFFFLNSIARIDILNSSLVLRSAWIYANFLNKSLCDKMWSFLNEVENYLFLLSDQ